jgi:hypothetical protein
MSRVLEETGCPVQSSDLYERGYGDIGYDFLEPHRSVKFSPVAAGFFTSRSRPREWCSSWWLTAFADIGRAGQLAIVGRLTAGSSLNGAMVSRVM